MPLAAAGIACLGLTPTFGGPERPLHWAMTAGMVGFGALLWARHHFGRRERATEVLPPIEPRSASRTLLLITGSIAAMVCVIVGSRVFAGKPLGPLSVLMPAAGLLWLTTIGLKIRRLRLPPQESQLATDRPSRRPPKRDSVSPPPPGPGDSAANRHVSA